MFYVCVCRVSKEIEMRGLKSLKSFALANEIMYNELFYEILCTSAKDYELPDSNVEVDRSDRLILIPCCPWLFRETRTINVTVYWRMC